MHLRLVGILWLALVTASTLALHAKPPRLQKRFWGIKKWAGQRKKAFDLALEDAGYFVGWDRPCPTQKKYPCMDLGLLAGVICDVPSENDWVDMGYNSFDNCVAAETITRKGCNFEHYRFKYYAYLPNPKHEPAKNYNRAHGYFEDNERCKGWYPEYLVPEAMLRRQLTKDRARAGTPAWAPPHAPALALPKPRQTNPLPPAQVSRPAVGGNNAAPLLPQAAVQQSVVRTPNQRQFVAPLPVVPNSANPVPLNSGQTPSSPPRTSREGQLHDAKSPPFSSEPFISPPQQ